MNEASASYFDPAFDPGKPQFKIVLLGEGAVGKSSILLRYTQDKFNTKHLSTIEAAYASNQIFIDDKEVELNIWDTAGQEKFHSLGPIYYRGSQGALLVFDITDRNSFERVQNWVKELRQMLGDSAVLAVVGNKLDLDRERVVTTSEASEYSGSVGAIYCECSAKEDVGIKDAFEELSRAISTKINAEPVISRRRPGSRRNLRVVDDEQISRNRTTHKRCC